MNVRLHFLTYVFFSSANLALAFMEPATPPLPDVDRRAAAASAQEPVSQEQRRSVAQLQARKPRARVEFDPITGSPKSVWAGAELLSGSNGSGGAIPVATAARFAADDPHRATKAFLLEYRDLFRHGPEALEQARVMRQFVTPHNGLRTVVWQQAVDGIPVFEAVLISHTSRQGELVNLSSGFLPDAPAAVERGGQNRLDLGASLKISARRAVALAAGQIGEQLSEEQVEPVAVSRPNRPAMPDPGKRQAFRARVLKGTAEARLVWLPMNANQLHLCWDVILTGRSRGEMFRVLVDVGTGEPLLRRCLTAYASDATYRVFLSDSPSPLSPGYSTPTSDQPPLVSRTLLTLSALDTNASPNGWIDDGVNETLGNNVDAHTDLDADDLPDLPRPQGSPFRVFDFPLDLNNAPGTYRDAAVAQLFYWCNWMHDQLYGLGFTEEAGNFQDDNFGRGGLGDDAIQADAQDGGGVNNANFSTPPDGIPGRMQMYLFNGPTPAHDGDLDAEIILHEYTHGLSNRRVGGGVGISALQSQGMGEGWSDFYALSLLSEPGDDVDGVYACAAYSAYRLFGLTQNYYFGIRRYPYCTDAGKNPLTFKDIDPFQASSHAGIPRNPVIGTTANEVHNMGEVWCVALWDARANLIRQHGWAAGNRLMLQLVTDGMALSPPNPNYLQARDAILQADQVDTGGANQGELWSAFAKRGMGRLATSPGSFTSSGVHESFEVPDDLQVDPVGGISFSFQSLQVPVPACQVFFLNNVGSNVVNWTEYTTAPWVSVDPTNGSIPPGTTNTANICLTLDASTLPSGDYSAAIVFSNVASGVAQTRSVALHLSLPRIKLFSLDTQPPWPHGGEWDFGKPAGLGGTENGSPDPAMAATGTNVFGINLNGDYSVIIGSPAYLVAGPFDFSGYAKVGLTFQRWLNTDYQPYVYATIEVSSDGTTWSPVWDNGTGEIADSAWTPVSYDLSTVADNHTNVYVRWGHHVAAPLAFAYSGWNLDDIEFVGEPAQQLTLTLPPEINVGVGTLTGMVMAVPAPATDLTVSFTSSDASVASVPASVTIPAGQTNVALGLVIADKLKGRGTQTVLIHAAAPDYVATSSSIEVFDGAAVALQLSLPDAATEGDGPLTGKVLIRDVQTNTLIVQLSSSDTTAIQVPDSVLIPAGQTSAVFAATVVDDNFIDGPQVAVVTAQASGWTDASNSVVVQDNENFNLAVALPASVWENSGPLPQAGSVTIAGLLKTNLTVSLTSSAPGRLSIPAEVTIPSGQISNTFDLTPIDNSIPDGSPLATIEASAPGFTNGTASVAILDDDTPPVPTNPSPADLSTNVDLASGLAWESGSIPGRTITHDVYFGTNSSIGPDEFIGSTTNQNWTLPLLTLQTKYYWQIVARCTGETQGPVWQFTTRGVDHFSWDPIPSPQQVNQPFTVVITARDADGSVLSNFNGMVSLRASSATLSPTNSGMFVDGVWQGSVTLSTAATNVSLVADDGAGHVGTSNPIDAAFINNISVTIAADSDPVPAGTSLTYTLMIANSGPADATEVTVTNTLPANATLVATLLSQGGWQETNGVITADLGIIFGGTNATITLTVIPTIVGDTLTNIASVSSAEADSYLGDNTAVIETKVGPPTISIADAAVAEGNTGNTDMQFAVTLSASSPETVSVNYSTTNGSAREDEDYFATNGILVLPPGISNAVITVTVIGDLLIESNESFFVNLSQPTNAVLGRGQAVGTILDDDGIHGQLDHFVWSAFTSPQYTNVPFAVTIAAADVAGNVVTGFVGTVALSASSGTGAVTAIGCVPTISPPFTNGMWSGEITLLDRGQNVQLQADDGSGHTGSSAPFEVVALNVPATVVSPPTNQVVVSGGSVAFSVIADGTPPLNYQWSFNGTNRLEATNSVLVITNAQLNDAGEYAVQVSNAFGAEQSSNAVLIVGEVPAIVVQPTNQTVRLGETTAFEVVAAGTAPLDYQWSFNSTNLLAATNSMLVITNVQLSDVGSYAVHVSNLFGSIDSSNAVLTIGLPPVIVSQPVGVIVPVGTAAAFSVVADGEGSFSYQWSFNTTNLLTATNSMLVITNAQLSDTGNYAVEVSNAFGSIESSNAALLVGVPPTISAQPTNQTVLPGTSATFAVVAAGTAPLNYQWRFTGTTLAGATSNVLVITNVQLGNIGSYAVSVSNQFGSTDSSNAALAFGGPPKIIIQPTNQAVPTGKVATLSVVAVGALPLSYQWNFISGPDLPAATNSVLLVTNAQNGDKYYVRIANEFGSVKSANATLSVGDPPLVVVQPTNATVRLGESATFSALANGSAPLTYQWRFNGKNLANATNSVLVILNAQFTNGGRYDLKVINAFGSDTSDSVLLSVGQEPVILVSPTNQTVKLGDPARFEVVADGTVPLDYQWSFNSTNLLDATNSVLVITNAQLSAAGEYAVQVSNAFGAEQSSNAVLIVGEPAMIVVQPTNQTIKVGESTAFEVVAAGTAPLDYQWSFNNTNLFTATNSVLVITNAQLSAAGEYAVQVSNAFGSEQSSNAVLGIGVPAAMAVQPTNLAVPIGAVATFSIVAEGTAPLDYQWSFNSTNLLDATNDVLVVTNVQLSDAGEYAVQVSNAFGAEQSSNAVLTVGEPARIASQPTNQTVRLGDPATFEVVAEGTMPLDYQWSFNGTNLLEATNAMLVIPNAQLSDAGGYAVRVSNLFGSTDSSNAVLVVGEPARIVIQPTNQTIRLGEAAVFEVVAAGTAPLDYQWSFNNTNLFAATNSVLVITNAQLDEAGGYAVQVSNAFGSEQSSNAVLIVGEVPTIAVQPTNQIIRLGTPVTFAVSASGTAPLDYQWSFNSTNLLDATNSVLVITNAELSDSGEYAVQVSNAFGLETSSNAVLLVGEAPEIIVQPTNQTIRLGEAAVFEVAATGTAPLDYQWSFNNTNLFAATNSVLVITNAQLSDAGGYAVDVSNLFGSSDSSNAVLLVGESPEIIVQPTNQTVKLGSLATLDVVVTGTMPLNYQWTFGDNNLLDATNSMLMITNVQLSDVGSYAVRVSNLFGSTDSSNALLAIGVPAAIVVQPTNLAVPVGAVAIFSIAADGTAPLNYQWSFNGTNRLEATNAVLVITNAQLNDAGEYAVQVSNAFGAEQSSNAVLIVGEVPAIVVQPTNQTVRLGETTAFEVVAAGTAPLDYQWSFNSANLLEATNSMLVITNVQLSDVGSFAVHVSNLFGSTDSSNALLAIGVPATIVVQPTNLAVPVGAVATFTIVAEGTPPLSYQWTFGDTNLLTATNRVLVITNLQLSDAGRYAVQVSNAFGSEASSNATLLVYVMDHFIWDPIPSPRFVNVPFPVRIQAADTTNGLVSRFDGSVVLGTTTGTPVNPALSGSFTLGTWTGSVTFAEETTNTVLVADDGYGHLGYANPINVMALPSLTVVLSGASVVISWPGEASAFVPETSTDLFSWSPLAAPSDLIGGKYQIRVRTTSTNFFVRLRFVGP